jgi:hypothetical protein
MFCGTVSDSVRDSVRFGRECPESEARSSETDTFEREQAEARAIGGQRSASGELFLLGPHGDQQHQADGEHEHDAENAPILRAADRHEDRERER